MPVWSKNQHNIHTSQVFFSDFMRYFLNSAILFINKINIWSLKINIPQLKFTFYYKETCLLLTQQGLKLRRTDISIKGIENSSQIFIIFEKNLKCQPIRYIRIRVPFLALY